MYQFFRPLLFHLDPERAHYLTLQILRLTGKSTTLCKLISKLFEPPLKPVKAFGLTFRNPVGLAAGYDKDGIAWRGLACLGFGHIEIGTVTPQPQPGNPKPRLFRLPNERALINRMGFPGKGGGFVSHQFHDPWDNKVVLGVNLGKNKETSLDSAVEDYVFLLRRFALLADYLVINVSSPNTVGLRRLQSRKYLENLLRTLDKERRILTSGIENPIPLLVKLSPDLTISELDDALEIIMNVGLDGVVVSNTTIRRDILSEGSIGKGVSKEMGGLSGAPLKKISTEMIDWIYKQSGGKLPIIGVGGIMNAEDAQEKLNVGASLVQIYTGLVYAGPSLVKQIVNGI
jgi:dihydroorotate dehydrogenase